jgi:Ala-tRNA(Pro) deacylase
MVATSDDLFNLLKTLSIYVSTMSHPAAHTVDEAKRLRGEILGSHCKNLFLKDKKGQLWLIVALESRQIDLKTLPKTIGSARLSFSKPELLMETLGITPGSLTPFALMNDTDLKVQVILDAAMLANEPVNYHPLSNEATTSLSSADLLKFIAHCGHTPRILDFDAIEAVPT